MDISPQRVRTAEFKTVKKGLDPDEVRAFLEEVAAELERAQNQSTAMEARARAAVARLQEISEATPAAPADGAVEPAPAVAAVPEPAADVVPSVDQAETISRTLLLAQRTADTAIAEAEAEAARLRTEAEAEATKTIASAQEISERLSTEAREEARKQGEAERIQVESEVNALLARRDFLESDVDHLQTFLVDERNRLREAANDILELVERVPAGLGEVRRPLLSASDDDELIAATSATSAGAAPESAAAEPAAEHLVTQEMPSIGSERAASDADAGDAAADDDGGFDWSGESDDTDADASDDDPLVIQTDISDEGPTGFSYDKNR
ncbi:DivIVA domain-containing protein [Ilumatobacter coccineus]|jgi:DivIVA domain-containing protein|uniref:Cell wall synthesis protein Wag31 n=1 Tax=Ilumatobacter coccineus (strain NBRC 103263 / KCTC 29153 / YM16-304) TaxID=1313172 RepID=A0A6C7ECB5_ILUCY|nr:DivIVA domain-containing protein [Ilumatobacter coccineus]BAN02268.1 hypothetical protein YM304_19540 [Ilumatobacter coccineus YM16-304]